MGGSVIEDFRVYLRVLKAGSQEISVHRRSQEWYSQQPKGASNLMDGETEGGTCTQQDSSLRREARLAAAPTGMKPKDVPPKPARRRRTNTVGFPLDEVSGQSQRDSRRVVAGGLGWGVHRDGELCNGDRVSVLRDEKSS